MNNLDLWNKVCITDVDTTKNFKGKGGFQGTAVCAQSQRKKATEIFGVYGIGWKVQGEDYNVISFDETDAHYSKIFYTAVLTFTYNENIGQIPIASEIDVFTYSVKYKSWSIGNDLYKKVRTDALTKGLSELGFNADVFEGKFDDNKYVQSLKDEQQEPQSKFDRNKAIMDLDALMIKLKCTDLYTGNIQSQYSQVKNEADYKTLYGIIEGEN